MKRTKLEKARGYGRNEEALCLNDRRVHTCIHTMDYCTQHIHCTYITYIFIQQVSRHIAGATTSPRNDDVLVYMCVCVSFLPCLHVCLFVCWLDRRDVGTQTREGGKLGSLEGSPAEGSPVEVSPRELRRKHVAFPACIHVFSPIQNRVCG